MNTSRRAQAYLVHYKSGETNRPDRAVFLDADRAQKYAVEHHGTVSPLQDMVLVTVKQCTNPALWYADKINQSFGVIAVDNQGVWTRGDNGFINVIDWRDI